MRRENFEPAASARIAVIVPIFKHSVLVCETLDALLTQSLSFPLKIILVNDGCPFAETHEVCRDFAISSPETVIYLRKPNGGLSSARNFGIRYALDRLERIGAIYLMDADNLLRDGALPRAMAYLDDHPEIDWLYPDIDMFGLNRQFDYGGAYSRLIHGEMNLCEAGSLIRRRVFEAGVMFDEDFKLGWEDWDFFLSATEAGFRGENLENFGFLYRKRPESMLADAARDAGAISGAMEAKHRDLTRPKRQLALEAEEAPRYAILLADQHRVCLCVDPQGPAEFLSYDQYRDRYWHAHTSPGRARIPPFLIAMRSGVMTALKTCGLLNWALWHMERGLETSKISALSMAEGEDDRFGIRSLSAVFRDGAHLKAVTLAMSPDLLSAILRDASTSWVEGLQTPISPIGIMMSELSAPAQITTSPGLQCPTAASDLVAFITAIRDPDLCQMAAIPWEFRQPAIGHRGQEHRIIRNRIGGGVAFPKAISPGLDIGFVLPLAEFGGVEKVALQMAKGLKAQGWRPHAFIIEAQSASMTQEWRTTFETTSFLCDERFRAWGEGQEDYLGTQIPDWTTAGDHRSLLGLLCWLDVVVNLHGGAAAGAMGQLRRFGVTTVNSLHLNDLTSFGRPMGNSYLGLAFEHAFDLFAPCSHQLGDWLHGSGIPAEKIIPVQNAPGFDLSPAQNRDAQLDRKHRKGALRVLFLGRLDRQKGLDRLAAVMELAERERLDLDWRIVGKAVLAGDAPNLPARLLSRLEPPSTDPEQLAKFYDWADVVVLLSRYEGLPLTVLEAMRAGAIPLCTNVGAVSEVIETGRTGILLDEEDVVGSCVQALSDLSRDRARVSRLSDTAFQERSGYDWVAATKPLHEALLGILRAKGKPVDAAAPDAFPSGRKQCP